jgi:predicted RNA binding protein YcfA (HicA-like mRNA interferase family)
MSKLPGSVPVWKVIHALQRDGWIVIRHQNGSHIQLKKRDEDGDLRLTISDHDEVGRIILKKILKVARLDDDRFLDLL